jgi:hypothetical protein
MPGTTFSTPANSSPRFLRRRLLPGPRPGSSQSVATQRHPPGAAHPQCVSASLPAPLADHAALEAPLRSPRTRSRSRLPVPSLPVQNDAAPWRRRLAQALTAPAATRRRTGHPPFRTLERALIDPRLAAGSPAASGTPLPPSTAPPSRRWPLRPHDATQASGAGSTRCPCYSTPPPGAQVRASTPPPGASRLLRSATRDRSLYPRHSPLPPPLAPKRAGSALA